MKERPILFSGPMVRAILEGRKTQTRRVVKCDSHVERLGTPHEWNRGRADDRMKRWEDWGPRTGHVLLHSGASVFALQCPYGQPGDRLWVRETWKNGTSDDCQMCGYPCNECPIDKTLYAADVGDGWRERGPWRPSIFMPRSASRILLEVTDVRVERVQDMEGQAPYPGESDAIAEGMNRIHHGDGAYYFSAFRDEPHPKNWADPTDAFRELWNGINAKRGFGWDANPWVWVTQFRRIDPIDNQERLAA